MLQGSPSSVRPINKNKLIIFLQERIPNPSHRTLAKQPWLRDKQKRAEGWIPVLVQGVVWSRKLNLCGTCDVLWFKCSKTYSPVQADKHIKLSAKFHAVFEGKYPVRDILYDQGGFRSLLMLCA
eukprot:g12111.t1